MSPLRVGGCVRVLGLLMALALLPLAAAQAPDLEGGSVEVQWAFAPPEPELRQGSFLDMVATARVAVRDAACPGVGEARVELGLAPAEGSGLATSPLLLAFNVTVPQGVHGAAGQPAHEAEATVPFALLADLNLPAGEYVLEGTPAIRPPRGCAGIAGEGPAPSQVRVPVRVSPAPTVVVEHPPHEEHGAGGFELFLDAGAARNHTFNRTGEFPYHDHFRPELRGVVFVGEQGAPEAEVRVHADGFRPKETRIGVGGMVTWRNVDTLPHTASADELHPNHASEDHHDDEPDEAPSQGGSGPPRRAPGLEALGLLAALGLGARARRRA